MKYRQAKKFLTKALSEAMRMQDEHILSNSANRLVKNIKHELDLIKARKKSNDELRIADFDYGTMV